MTASLATRFMPSTSGIDEHDVGDGQPGQGLGVVVLVEELDRPPSRPAESGVDAVDSALHLRP